MHREEQVERRAVADAAIDRDIAADLLHQRVHLGHSKPRSAVTFGREIGIEDPFGHLGRHAEPVVANPQPDEFHMLFFGNQRRADPDRSAARHCVTGIHDEVEDCRVELRRIHEALGKVGCEIEHDADSRTGAIFEEQLQLAQQCVHVFGTRHELLLLCEGEEPVGHLHASLDPVPDRRERGIELLRVIRIRFGDTQAAGDNTKHVSEIMGDPAGHLAKRADLLGRAPAAGARR